MHINMACDPWKATRPCDASTSDKKVDDGVCAIAYQDMLAGVFGGVDPPRLIQHPLLPLGHIPYVLPEPYQPIPPTCSCDTLSLRPISSNVFGAELLLGTEAPVMTPDVDVSIVSCLWCRVEDD